MANYHDLTKSKLSKTRWVERLDALEVTIDLLEAVVDSLVEINLNASRKWNRDTVSQASSLLKGIDFEFNINLVTTQRVLAYTSSINIYRLQQRDLDMVRAYEDIQLVIHTLEQTRTKVEAFHHEFCSELADKLDVEVKKPHACKRQHFRQNANPFIQLLTKKLKITSGSIYQSLYWTIWWRE